MAPGPIIMSNSAILGSHEFYRRRIGLEINWKHQLTRVSHKSEQIQDADNPLRYTLGINHYNWHFTRQTCVSDSSLVLPRSKSLLTRSLAQGERNQKGLRGASLCCNGTNKRIQICSRAYVRPPEGSCAHLQQWIMNGSRRKAKSLMCCI